MGRQAHVTRLALGRSPFEPPLRDQYGNFILGPHAHDDAAKDYVQQFDGKGHPTNGNSEIAARKLRRAQNDVLEVAGVVLRKDEEALDSWKAMDYPERIGTVASENLAGLIIQVVHELLAPCTWWWLVSFQHRLMTFRSYSALPLFATIASELRILGPVTFFFAGLPLATITGLAHVVRSFIDGDTYANIDLCTPPDTSHKRTLPYRILSRLEEIGVFTVVWPLELFATLQSLHLVSATTMPSFWSLLPLSNASPIRLPLLPSEFSHQSIKQVGFDLLASPLLIGYARDRLRTHIRRGLYAVIRQLATKPDSPDQVSIEAVENDESTLENHIAGLGVKISSTSRYHGPSTVMGALRIAFPGVFAVWRRLAGTSASVEPPQSSLFNEDILRGACSSFYRSLVRHNRSRTEDQRASDAVLRSSAVQAVLAGHHVDPAMARIDVQRWADDISVVDSQTSTTTPEPQDLFNLEEVIEPDRAAGEHNPSPSLALAEPPLHDVNIPISLEDRMSSEYIDTDTVTMAEILHDQTEPADSQSPSFRPTVPLETLLASVDHLTNLPNESLLPSIEPLEAPTPGIRRALSLPLTIPRPVRRPTEIDQDLGPTAEELRSMTPAYRRLHQSEDPVFHRVTILSNHPADSIAMHCSQLLVSLIMLPLDVYYFRLVAQRFLISGFGVLAQTHTADVWPTNLSAGFREMGLGGSLRFGGRLLLTFGMQGLTSSVIWGILSASTVNLGRQFGWGMF